MHRTSVFLMAGASLALFTSMVLAAPEVGIVPVFKTSEMQASDTISIPIGIHVPAPDGAVGAPPFTVAGWAGTIAKVHVLDASEVDVDGLILPGGPTGGGITIPDPFGPRSENAQSQPRAFTNWHPLAPASGIQVNPSQVNPLLRLDLHVKNSHPSGNSDIDLSVMGWNIWHLRGNTGPGSTLIRLNPSDLIWVNSNIDTIDQLHSPGSFFQFPTNPAPFDDPNAHWLHVQQPVTFHLFGGPGSQFFATMVGTLGIGIEHVPEPATGGMLMLGVAFLGASLWCRRRRIGR